MATTTSIQGTGAVGRPVGNTKVGTDRFMKTAALGSILAKREAGGDKPVDLKTYQPSFVRG